MYRILVFYPCIVFVLYEYVLRSHRIVGYQYTYKIHKIYNFSGIQLNTHLGLAPKSDNETMCWLENKQLCACTLASASARDAPPRPVVFGRWCFGCFEDLKRNFSNAGRGASRNPVRQVPSVTVEELSSIIVLVRMQSRWWRRENFDGAAAGGEQKSWAPPELSSLRAKAMMLDNFSGGTVGTCQTGF